MDMDEPRVECVCGLYMSRKKRPKFASFVSKARELGLLVVDVDLDGEPWQLTEAAEAALGRKLEGQGVTFAILHKVCSQWRPSREAP